MHFLDILVWLAIAPACLCLIVLTAEVLLGLRRLAPSARVASGRVVIIIPAHNESATIGHTLARLGAHCPVDVRRIVVADNCTDHTAEIAASHGCEVLVRTDPSRRGKGYALAFAHDYLLADCPDVVIVLDADCEISEGGIEALACAVLATGGGAQSVNLQFDRSGRGGLVEISNFALLVKNLVRTRGLQRLSGSSALFGTGMALPWAQFRREMLETDNIVDDLALTIDLARAGVRCRLVESAVVSSPSADWGETINQRRRWEHGFVTTGMTKAFPLLLLGIRRGSRRLWGYALHLMVPPLALLMITALVILLAAVSAVFLGASRTPAETLAVLLAAAGLALVLAWFREGREVLAWQSLINIPIYALRKIPIYAGLVLSRHTSWTRTRRDGEAS